MCPFSFIGSRQTEALRTYLHKKMMALSARVGRAFVAGCGCPLFKNLLLSKAFARGSSTQIAFAFIYFFCLQDKTQLTMICTWLVEIYLNTLNSLKDEGDEDSYKTMQDEFRSFLRLDRVQRNLDRPTA